MPRRSSVPASAEVRGAFFAGDYERGLAMLKELVAASDERDRVAHLRSARKTLSEALDRDRDSAAAHRARAAVLSQLGKLDEAVADLGRAIDVQPDVDALIERAGLLETLGRVDLARQDFDAALGLDPDSVVAHGMKGQLLLRAGDVASLQHDGERATAIHREALAEFDIAVRLAPELPFAYLSRAMAYSRLNQADVAIADLDASIDLDPRQPDVYRLRAEVRRAAKDLKAAIADLGRAIDLEPTALLHRMRAEAYAVDGDVEAAIADCTVALRLAPDDLDHYRARAELHVQAGDSDAALDDYVAMTTLAPDNPMTQEELAGAYARISRWEEAIAAYTRVIELDPTFQEAWNNRGVVFERLGDYRRALDDYDESLRLQPDSPVTLRNRGDVLAAIGDVMAALASYDRALELDAEYSEGYTVRAALQHRLGNVDAALTDYGHAIQLDPRLIEAYYGRAQVFEDRVDHERAAHDLDVVLSLDPSHVPAYVARGDLFRSTGEPVRALWDYDRAVELDPAELAGYRGQALACIAIAETEEQQSLDLASMRDWYEHAVAACDRGLKIDPDDVSLHRQRGAALIGLQAYDDAAAALDRALRSADPDDLALTIALHGERADALRMWSESCALPERSEQALAELEGVMARADETSATWLWEVRAAAATLLDRHREAAAFLERALLRAPDQAIALLGLGRARYLMGDHDAARETFTRVLTGSDMSSHAAAHVGLGLLLDAVGDGDAARAHYQRARAGDSAESYLDRADLYDLCRAFALAEQDELEAIRLAPDSPSARNAFAWRCAAGRSAAGRLDDALRHAERAVTLEGDGPNRGNYVDTLGWVRFRLGHYEEAVEDLREAVRLLPRSIVFRHHLDVAQQVLTKRGE